MQQEFLSPLKLCMQVERWPMAVPFRITGRTFEVIEVLVVSLETAGLVGRGEAAGIYYKNDTPTTMLKTIEALRTHIEAGLSIESLQRILPPGGARNAIDCALWDLKAKIFKKPVWQLGGLAELKPLVTTFGCGADSPANMAGLARSYAEASAIKLKLTGEKWDADRVLAVREARPDVWLAIDANQGFTQSHLETLMPVLVKASVSLIEQPFPTSNDSWLDGLQAPIPIAADESVLSLADIPQLAGRYQVVNIKLDKCGGLTEGLAMARECRAMGLDTMVGNMLGTSLAMAPAFIVGQLCSVVDLDGPIFLKRDRSDGAQYRNGRITCHEAFWGGADAA